MVLNHEPLDVTWLWRSMLLCCLLLAVPPTSGRQYEKVVRTKQSPYLSAIRASISNPFSPPKPPRSPLRCLHRMARKTAKFPPASSKASIGIRGSIAAPSVKWPLLKPPLDSPTPTSPPVPPPRLRRVPFLSSEATRPSLASFVALPAVEAPALPGDLWDGKLGVCLSRPPLEYDLGYCLRPGSRAAGLQLPSPTGDAL